MKNSLTVITLSMFAVLAATVADNLHGDEPVDLNNSSVSISRTESRATVKLLSDSSASDRRIESHPVLPLLRIAREGLGRVTNDIRDYTCVMIKRELVGNQMFGPERISAKVRHEQVKDGEVVSPFSLYLKFEAPKSMRNREVLYTRPEPDGIDRLLVKKGGKRLSFLTFFVEPTSPLAMTGNRYPITEFGLQRMIERMIMFGEQELAYRDCKVETRNNVHLNDRVCTCIEVEPKRRPDFQYQLARIFIDDEMQVPIRFESYAWPGQENDRPVLLEEYTFRDLKLNVGLTAADFQRDNPSYGFR